VGEAVREMYPFSRDRVRQSAMQITTMKRIVRRTKSPLDAFAQRRTKQNTTVIPAPLDKTGRLDACLPQFVSNPHPMQNTRRIGANIDASADLAEHFCLFVNLNVKSGSQQQDCRREATDAAANNCDGGLTCDRHFACLA
jgi:hypothetical protein